MKQALTIAGSDSGGGAGIQADLKTFHAHGVFGMSVVTAVTAQNTQKVTGAFDLPADAEALHARSFESLVVDPVMISKSGYKLLEDDAIDSLKSKLLPLAFVVTPNMHEAALLAGTTIESMDGAKAAAKKISDYGCRTVIVKGGHSEFSPGTDLMYDGKDFHEFTGKFIEGAGAHGTGCTFSAAITARLALGEPLVEAVRNAKRYITSAIEHSPDVGKGHHPTNHFYFVTSDDYKKE